MHPTISGYLMEVRQGDAARVGERDRLLAEIRCARTTTHPAARHLGPARRLARHLGPARRLARHLGPARRLARRTAAARTTMTVLRVKAHARVNGC